MRFARLAALLALPFAAAAQGQAPQQKPKLIVVMAVDQLSSELFTQYRQRFDGGFERLSEGVVFPAGYQGHNATETCPGHSTILTGSRPSRTGIIANSWFNPSAAREDKEVYCAEDPRVPGSNSNAYTVSTYHLRVPALGDLMKRADPRARVAVVAGKDRAAAMMGGYGPDERWWWGGNGFVSHAGRAAPGAIRRVNDAVAEALSKPRAPRDLPKVCEPHARAVPIQGGGGPVGDGRLGRVAGDRSAFRQSPDFDRAVLDAAEGLRRDMRLGEGEAPDLLVVGLSANDYVGHRYGTQGAEMCLQLLALDEALGGFFKRLDATGIDYVVALTSDHGGFDIPERHRDHAVPSAERIDGALNAANVNKAVAARLGIAGDVILGEGAFGDMYAVRTLTPKQRARVLKEAIAFYRGHRQVAAVFTREQLAAAPAPAGPPDQWTLIERAKASFDPQRSGDFIVLLKPRVMPIFDTSRGYVATHGSPWDYDRRVPILFWRKGLVPFEQPLAVETADIMPTLAALIGLPVAMGAIDGRCLDLDEGPQTTCPAPGDAPPIMR